MMASAYADQKAMVHQEVLLEQLPTCPNCGHDLDFDGVRVFCLNEKCGWLKETKEVQD